MSDQTASRLPTLRDVLARAHLRLIIFSVAMAGVVLLFSGIIIIRGYVERNLALVARTASYTIEPAVVFGDVDAIRDGLNEIAGMNDVRQIDIVSVDGTLIARWQKPGSGKPAGIEPVQSNILWPGPATSPIQRSGKIIAEVRVHGGIGGFLRFLRSGLLVAISCLGLAVVATQMLARRLRNDVLDPLARVTEVAHDVRTNRTFGKRVPASGIFEIDQFGQDFNALLTELEGWHATITHENKVLSHQATHDNLTGLGNRAYFERKLQSAVNEAERTGAPFAVLYVDANKFKQINDTYGHNAGDTILQNIAMRLMASIRSNDFAFRQGGDEFAAILGASVTRTDVERVIERIARLMAQEIELPDGKKIFSSVSVGYALYPEDGRTVAELVHSADAAMYKQKTNQH
ncbi:MAG TPA: diguanylate cyclase [Hyphomonas sp.]|nr:diguanylate cyclase [Hyphomonas sp.]